MKPAFLARTLHKWLALIVGVQLAIWTLSGFYMVVVDLDFIHGDPLVRNLRTPLELPPEMMSPSQVVARYPEATGIALRALPGLPAVYEVTRAGRPVLLDAASGEELSPLPEATVRALARAYYAGQGDIASVRLIERDPPLEIQSRPLPLWRVDFDDWLATSLYIHPDTGRLVTRRHRFWRWFDFFWMLHIMDYESRADVNNGLLRGATVIGAITVASGLWLLYFSFRRRRSHPARGAS